MADAADLIPCPVCGSERVVAVVDDPPAAAGDALVHFGERVISEDNPQWHCQDCGHEW